MPKKPEQPLVSIGDITLTPEQIREKAIEALGVMYGSIDPMKIAQMTATAQAQAANGDATARQFVYNLIRNGLPSATQAPAGPAVVNQVNIGTERPDLLNEDEKKRPLVIEARAPTPARRRKTKRKAG
jgi:hypothetical protein